MIFKSFKHYHIALCLAWSAIADIKLNQQPMTSLRWRSHTPLPTLVRICNADATAQHL